MSAPLGRGYIPNRICRPLGIATEKMFCGRFSTSGDVLLTASQDSVIKLYDSQDVYQWSAKEAGNHHKDTVSSSAVVCTKPTTVTSTYLTERYSSSNITKTETAGAATNMRTII